MGLEQVKSRYNPLNSLVTILLARDRDIWDLKGLASTRASPGTSPCPHERVGDKVAKNELGYYRGGELGVKSAFGERVVPPPNVRELDGTWGRWGALVFGWGGGFPVGW